MQNPGFYTKKLEQTDTYGKFIIEPLPLSFGDSIGNSLRRTLLSSLRGAVITQVKIVGVPHMFSTIKGVKETALELILNLQLLKFDAPRDGSFKVTIDVKGEKKVTGKDIGRSTILQATHGETVSEKDLQPGDLVFFRGSKGHFNDSLFPPEKYGYNICIGHVAIYTGDGMAIHASGEKGRVIEESLEEIKRTRVKIPIIKRI